VNSFITADVIREPSCEQFCFGLRAGEECLQIGMLNGMINGAKFINICLGHGLLSLKCYELHKTHAEVKSHLAIER
jgi:hypothetical protein